MHTSLEACHHAPCEPASPWREAQHDRMTGDSSAASDLAGAPVLVEELLGAVEVQEAERPLIALLEPWVSRARQSFDVCMQEVVPAVEHHADWQQHKTGRGWAKEGTGMSVEPEGRRGAG